MMATTKPSLFNVQRATRSSTAVHAGRSDRLNPLDAISTIVSATNTEIRSENLASSNYPGTRDQRILCYNKDTGQLLVSNDVTTDDPSFSDHVHTTYALAKHTHQFGANVPWLAANPQLWYRADLHNHPELIPLDGRLIAEEDAHPLDEVFTGDKLVTTFPDQFNGLFYNEDLTLTVSNHTPQGYGKYLFGDPIEDITAIGASEQWLTDSKDLNQAQWFKFDMTHGHYYRPTTYVMIPACGTPLNPLVARPTPKSWKFEGVPAEAESDDAWELIDQRENITDWSLFRSNVYTVDTRTCYRSFKVTITEWNAGAVEEGGDTYYTGLRRFYLLGRNSNLFAVPMVPSPNPDFVYVVPKTNMSIGLRHEDIGDIGITALRPELLPPYRVAAQGQQMSTERYPLLRAAIGGKYDPEAEITSTEALADGSIGSVIEINEAGVLSSLHVNTSIPVAEIATLTVQGSNDKSDWALLYSFSSNSGQSLDLHEALWLDQLDDEVAYKYFKLTITLSPEHTTDQNTASINTVCTHPVGKFHMPQISAAEGVTTYVVADIPTTDVSAEIISKLQSAVSNLMTAHQQLQNQVNSMHPVTQTAASTTARTMTLRRTR